ncbi:hypothetical protein QBC46DRAFT_444761 [Diplogelasinospora grovesii]|uniref:C2H2-type domain-containing protein n=1 Tax=Diplogelasinospora grovesii TaxID=303347 RepID=A0AAN6NHK8_9PEZI|nr:hypothetical protein QBC46DRAFT_444761 [Diplogelasinospora grovesii]
MEHQYLFTTTSYPSYYLEDVAFQHNQDSLLDPALISDNNNNNPTIYSPSPPPASQHGQWEAPSQVQRFLSETQKTPFFGGTDFPTPRMNPNRAVPQRPAAGIRPVPSPSQSHSQGLRFGSPISSIEPSSTTSGSALSPPADNEWYPHTPPETALFSPYQQPHQPVAPYDKWSTAAQAHQFAGIGCVNLNDINPNNNSQAASHVDYCENDNYDFDFSASQLLYGGGGSSDSMDSAIVIDFNNNNKERMASPEEDEMDMHSHSAAIIEEEISAAASPYPPLLSTTEDDIGGSDDDDSSSQLQLLPPLSKRKKAAADDDGEYKPTGSKRSKSSSSSSPTRRGPGRPSSKHQHQQQVVDLPVRRRSSPDGSPNHTSPARKRNKTTATTTTTGGTGGGTTSTFPAQPSAAPKMLANSSKGSFPCETCGQPFKDQTLLDNHFKKIHQRPFKCVFHFAGCGSIFASKNEWKRHVTSQHLGLHYWLCQEGVCAKTVNSDAHHLPRGKMHRTGLGASTLLTPSSGGTSGSGSGSLPNGSIFNRKDLYTQHLRRMHTPPGIKKSYKAAKKAGTTPSASGGGGGEIAKWEEHIKKLQQRAEIKRCKLPEFMACPVGSCRQEFTGTEAWDQRMEHVARHLDRAASSSSEKEEDVVVVVFGGEDDSTLVDWASHPDVNVIKRSGDGGGGGGGGGEWELNDPLKKRGGTHTGNSSSGTHVHGGQQQQHHQNHHQGETVIVAHTPRSRGQDSVRSEIVVGEDGVEVEEEQEQEQEEDMVDVDADADADADGEEDDT